MSDTDERTRTSGRKRDHLDLCANEDVEFDRKTTLLEEVELLHDALPELALDEINLSTRVLGKRLGAPIVITGMTGGVDEAVALNRCLAELAERHGLAFGLGSQRPMLDSRDASAGYLVRDVAPTALLLGNIGAVQAVKRSTSDILGLVEAVGADALAVHLNPGQELIQPEGDRDFRGVVDAIHRLSAELPVPVLVKETGCGLGPIALAKLQRTGVRWVDVSGAGGTTWVGVESKRAQDRRGAIGTRIWDWGTPTAVATVAAAHAGFSVVASGGLRSGYDVVRALALGADAAGMALPFLRAYYTGGATAVEETIELILEEIRVLMCLVGCPTIDALHRVPRFYGRRLVSWLEQLGLVADPT